MIRALSAANVDCIAYARSAENVGRLVRALQGFNPRLRISGVSEPIQWKFDAKAILNGSNFTLETDLGDVDLLGRVDGFVNYNELSAHSKRIDVFGVNIKMLGIRGLIRAKSAANRAKDQLAIPELQALLEAESAEDAE